LFGLLLLAPAATQAGEVSLRETPRVKVEDVALYTAPASTLTDVNEPDLLVERLGLKAYQVVFLPSQPAGKASPTANTHTMSMYLVLER
jgi:hypothetical protein